MKHTYNIQGMTCNNCKQQVEQALNNNKNIQTAKVDLKNGTASIEMNEHISLEELQKLLPEKYIITNETAAVSQTEEESDFKKLYPLFLIFLYISIASVAISWKSWNTDAFMLDFMGLFFIVFSFFKLLDLKGFKTTFQTYDPLAKVLPSYGLVYPFIETILGVLFLTRLFILPAVIATIVILGITTVGVTKVLFDKKSIQCACLGTALKLPMTKATFIENAVMLLMSFWMIIQLLR